MDSGSSQPTQTSQVTIPTYAKPYMTDLLGKAAALTSAEYQPYEGERVAPATADQLAARAAAAELQTPGQFDVATGMVGAAGLAGLGSQYSPSTFSYEQVSGPTLQQYQAQGPADVAQGLGSFTAPGIAQQYMSPYQQAVTDVQKAAALREAQMAATQESLAAARRPGSSRSYGQAIAQAERERGLLSRLAEIQATGSQAAFDAAQRAFEAEQARGLQAGLQTQRLGTETDLANLRAKLGVQELGARSDLEAALANQRAALEAAKMGEQSSQFGAEFGLKGQELGLRAGESMAKLGATELASEMDRLKFQEAMGQLSQADAQRLQDLQYQDFLNQKQFPYQNIGFMSDILRGTAGLAGTGGRSIYEAPASPLQQIVGPGLLGLGLYKEFMS